MYTVMMNFTRYQIMTRPKDSHEGREAINRTACTRKWVKDAQYTHTHRHMQWKRGTKKGTKEKNGGRETGFKKC